MENVPVYFYFIGFLLVLGPLVFFHELGHYAVGRWFGVKAEVFSIGFGKELGGWTDKRGTRWKLCALPLGGYVQFAGDMNPSSQPDAEWKKLPEAERNQTFPSKPLWQRALIVLAGPMANFILAIAILTTFALAYGQQVTAPVVNGFAEASNAEKAGLQVGDRIVAADGNAIDDFDDLPKLVLHRPNESIALEIERDGARQTITVPIAEQLEKDRFGNVHRIGRLGITSGQRDIKPVEWYRAPVIAIEQTVYIVKVSVEGLWQIITGRRPITELGGPVKIAKFSGEQFSLGWWNFVQFAAFISINLGFINLLPIPMLDGGHLAFYAAEGVRRKPVSARTMEWAFRTGLAVVLAFMVFVTVNDVASLPLFAS